MKKEFFRDVLISLSRQSKCVSKRVGVLIVKDDRIISTGYNGTLAGVKNCNEVFDANDFNREQHHHWSIRNEIHAEQNAIAIAAKNGISLNNATCYSSLQPCNSCLMSLVQSGIKEIVYLQEYDKSDYSQELLQKLKAENIVIRKFD
jgi:dCMP deaminase